MYFSIVFVIFALLIVFIFATCRRRWAVKKVYSMCSREKCILLNELAAPLGYHYIEDQDIISSRNDAWQRNMGYTSLFDHAAAHFNMVFDYLPVYFDYCDRTWLIEFWKGQYGINSGAEIGIYYSDRLLPKEDLSTALFQAVDDRDMLPLSFELTKQRMAGFASHPYVKQRTARYANCPYVKQKSRNTKSFHSHETNLLASVSKKTWWLTAFCMGRFSQPQELDMNSSIHFPDCEMRCQFIQGLKQSGLSKEHIRCCGNTVSVRYCGADKRDYGFFALLTRKLSQLSNQICCNLYLLITRPFTLTLDRLLYLYFLLPFAFRRMLTPRRYRRPTRHTR